MKSTPVDVADATNQSERELQRSLLLLRATIDSVTDGILVVDREGKASLFNGPFAEMWRIPNTIIKTKDPDQLIRFVLDQLKIPGEFLPGQEAHDQTALESADVIELKDGRTFERHSKPQRIGSQIVGTVFSFRDVTQSRFAEANREQALALAKLRRRTAELQAVLDNMREGVWACDENKRLFLINRAGLKSMNLSEAAIGRSVVEVVGSIRTRDSKNEDDLPIVRALRGETVLDAGLTIESQNRGRPTYFRTNATPILDDNGRITAAVAVTRDMTEEVELEQLKDEFMKVAAHELKTPVSIMKAFAQLALRQGSEPGPSLRKTLEAIERGANRIDNIVGSLLDVSELHIGQLHLANELIDLLPLVDEAIRCIKNASSRVVIVGDQPAVILGDRKRLKQVLTILIDNAIRYSPEGGQILVSVAPSDELVQISVEDRGIGIPQDRQFRIFERFFRAHSGTPHDYGGLGVSLHIARATIAQHGGTISFESKEGVGTRFMVALPSAAKQNQGTNENVKPFSTELGAM